jgi:hypothetical protein
MAVIILAGAHNVANAAPEAKVARGCIAISENQQITEQGTVVLSATTEEAEGVAQHTFTALVLDDPIGFGEEQIRLLAVTLWVSRRWLGHHVIVTGEITSSGEGEAMGVRHIKDVR